MFTRATRASGLPLDSLLRACLVGHAVAARRWLSLAQDQLSDSGAAARAVEHGLTAMFEYVTEFLRRHV